MELRHLRYFVAVAESLHFGHAAAQLAIAQPSLSQQIGRLEAELHTILLRRTKRRVELTAAGRLFLEESRDILARADRAAVIARRAGDGDTGRLRVGIGYCMDHAQIIEAVSLFTAQHAAIRVEVQTLPVPLQFTALRDGRLDVGFVRPPVPEPALAGHTLTREPLVVALPSRHRLGTKERMSLSTLADETFVLVSRNAVPVYHDIVLKVCREAGFVPNAPHEADQLPLILGMVAAGRGVALVPAFARQLKPPRVVFVPLRAIAPEIETAVAWRRDDPSPATIDFVTSARRALGRPPRTPRST